jgi:hypothetical protein
MADDEEIWEAFRRMKAGDTFGAGGSRNVTHRGVTIGPFEAHTREERYKMLYDTNNKMIQGWAGTSGNDHIYALAMQQAAKDEFGLTGAVHSRAAGNIESLTQTFEGSPVSEAATKQLAELRAAYEKDGDYLRRFLRHQYQVTQDAFAAQGITHVSVYRGMNFSTISEPEWAGRFYDRADEVAAARSKGPNITTAADRQRLDAIKTAPRPLMLQPMNSWSTSPRTARNFGDTIFKMEIPVDRVVGSAATGFGCLSETEFVIFDSAGLADLYMHRGAIVENMART